MMKKVKRSVKIALVVIIAWEIPQIMYRLCVRRGTTVHQTRQILTDTNVHQELIMIFREDRTFLHVKNVHQDITVLAGEILHQPILVLQVSNT